MGSGPSQSRIRVAACEALDPPAVSVIEMSFFESGSDRCASEDRARFLAKRTSFYAYLKHATLDRLLYLCVLGSQSL